MKKIINLVLVSILLFTFTGCGNSHEEEIKSNVNEYFTVLKGGDYAGTSKVCSEDYNDGFGVKEFYDSLNTEFKNAQMGATFDKEASEFVKKIMTKIFKSNNVESVEEKGDTATVIISGECIDLDSIDNIDKEVDLDGIGEEYANEHLTELQNIYATQGEEAMNNTIMEALAPIMFDEFEAYVDKANYIQYKMEVTVKNVDDKWLISNIDSL